MTRIDQRRDQVRVLNQQAVAAACFTLFDFDLATSDCFDIGVSERAIETIDVEPADMPWGVRMLRLRDPDGFKLVFSSPLK